MLRGRSRASRRHLESDHVVAFVHGYGAAGAVFDPMRARVEDALGVDTVDYTYGSSWGFERVVRGFADTLESVARPGRRLDIVGHSLGGLVARWYLQEHDGAAHVSRAVFLATPHDGTASARLALGPLRHVLQPRSPIIQRLAQGRARASSVEHTALVAGADRMVTPSRQRGRARRGRGALVR